jgi:hypothetical protein
MQIAKPEEFRVNIRGKLNKIIRKKKISLNLEKGIFNYTIITAKERNIVRNWNNSKFVMIYTDKLKSIMLNLSKKSSVKNTNLLERLKKGEFKPHEMAFMTHQEIFPEKWKYLI